MAFMLVGHTSLPAKKRRNTSKNRSGRVFMSLVMLRCRSNPAILSVIVLIAGLVSALSASAEVAYYVSPTGSDEFNGTTPEKPFRSLSFAIQTAVPPPQTVYLLAGAFNVSTTITVSRPLRLKNFGGSPNVVVQCTTPNTRLLDAHTAIEMHGIQFSHCSCVLRATDSVLMDRCIISGLEYENTTCGAVVDLITADNAPILLRNCSFANTRRTNGNGNTGIMITDRGTTSIQIEGSTFDGNSLRREAGVDTPSGGTALLAKLHSSSLRMESCAFTNNSYREESFSAAALLGSVSGGGAVRITVDAQTNSTVQIVISGCLFSSNTAEFGVFLRSVGATSAVTGTANSFGDAASALGGGSIWIMSNVPGGSTVHVAFLDSRFLNNKARLGHIDSSLETYPPLQGGAALIMTATGSEGRISSRVVGCRFEENMLVTDPDMTVNVISVGAGLAVTAESIEDSSALEVTETSFKSNAIFSAPYLGANICRGIGLGLTAKGTVHTTIERCTLCGNNVVDGRDPYTVIGEAISVNADAVITISRSIFACAAQENPVEGKRAGFSPMRITFRCCGR